LKEEGFRMDDMKRVLVIDDEIDIVTMIHERLKSEGYEVRGAYDGDDGLRTAAAFNPDLIILDMKMPRLTGMEFFLKIRSFDKHLKYRVLALTVQSELEEIFQELEIHGFMSKPFLMEDLVNEVGRILKIDYRKAYLTISKDDKNKKQVLIVENDAEEFNNIGRVFNEAGFVVKVAETGRAALELLEVKKPDIVLIKFWLNDMTGDRVIACLRQKSATATLPVILHTRSKDHKLTKQTFNVIMQGSHLSRNAFFQIVEADSAMQLLEQAKELLKVKR
jgi:DNA-binding response OmpR family regulator